MCGVVGLWSRATVSRNGAGIVREMSDALVNRGPDDAGVWADDTAGLVLGHRRLSIIDISTAGHQPMVSASGRYVLSYNGEIYNHLELRISLEDEQAAPGWRGHSDTETLLAAIAAWGLVKTLQRAVGMFALALWDRETRTLHLARDRLGEKPLYYAWIPGGLAFASELKALRRVPGFCRNVNRDVLSLYMQFGNVPAPHGIFEGLHKLRPASIVSVTEDALRRRDGATSEYWSFHDAAVRGRERQFSDENEALTELESRLKAAIAGQSIADVPLGAFLSGGVDSSLIAALMQSQSSSRVKTYTVGFEEPEYDESPFARVVAGHLGTEHHEVRLRVEDARAVIPDIPDIYDEPFADSSQIATHLVCKAARSHVKVALSGDGGDELFGGYNRYFWSRRVWNAWSRVPPFLRPTALRAIRGVPVAAFDRVGAAFGANSKVAHLGAKAHKVLHRLEGLRNPKEMHRLLLTEWLPQSGLVIGARPVATVADFSTASDGVELEEAMMMLDTLTYLPDDVLTKVDRAAMAVSLETRVPYLDHRVVEAAWRLPLTMRLRDGQGKWALRQILYKHVPRSIIERPKTGFAVPLGDWLRGPLRGWAESLLDQGKLTDEGYLDVEQVRSTWKEHLSGRQDWTQRLWYVLTFESWLGKHI